MNGQARGFTQPCATRERDTGNCHSVPSEDILRRHRQQLDDPTLYYYHQEQAPNFHAQAPASVSTVQGNLPTPNPLNTLHSSPSACALLSKSYPSDQMNPAGWMDAGQANVGPQYQREPVTSLKPIDANSIVHTNNTINQYCQNDMHTFMPMESVFNEMHNQQEQKTVPKMIPSMFNVQNGQDTMSLPAVNHKQLLVEQTSSSIPVGINHNSSPGRVFYQNNEQSTISTIYMQGTFTSPEDSYTFQSSQGDIDAPSGVKDPYQHLREYTNSPSASGASHNPARVEASSQYVQQTTSPAVYRLEPFVLPEESVAVEAAQGRTDPPCAAEMPVNVLTENNDVESQMPRNEVRTNKEKVCDSKETYSFYQESQEIPCYFVPVGMNYTARSTTLSSQYTQETRNSAAYMQEPEKNDTVHALTYRQIDAPGAAKRPLGPLVENNGMQDIQYSANVRFCEEKISSCIEQNSHFAHKETRPSIPSGMNSNATVNASAQNTQESMFIAAPVPVAAYATQDSLATPTQHVQASAQTPAKIAHSPLMVNYPAQQVQQIMSVKLPGEKLCPYQDSKQQMCPSIPERIKRNASSAVESYLITQQMQSSPVSNQEPGSAAEKSLAFHMLQGQVAAQQQSGFCLSPLLVHDRNQHVMHNVSSLSNKERMCDSVERSAFHHKSREEKHSSAGLEINLNASSATTPTHNTQQRASSITNSQIASVSCGECFTIHTLKRLAEAQQPAESCLKPLAATDRSPNPTPKVHGGTSKTVTCDSTEQRDSYQKTREETCSSVPMGIKFNSPATAHIQSMQQTIPSTTFGQIVSGPSQKYVKDPTTQSQAVTEQSTLHQLEVNDRNQPVTSILCSGTPNKKICDSTDKSASHQKTQEEICLSVPEGIQFNAVSVTKITQNIQQRTATVAFGSPQGSFTDYIPRGEAAARQSAAICIDPVLANDKNQNVVLRMCGGESIDPRAFDQKSQEGTCSSVPGRIIFNVPSGIASTPNVNFRTSPSTASTVNIHQKISSDISMQMAAASDEVNAKVYPQKFYSSAQQPVVIRSDAVGAIDRNKSVVPRESSETSNKEMFGPTERRAPHEKSQEQTYLPLPGEIMSYTHSATASTENLPQRSSPITSMQIAAGSPQGSDHSRQSQNVTPQPAEISTNPPMVQNKNQNVVTRVTGGPGNKEMCVFAEEASDKKSRDETCSSVPDRIMFNEPSASVSIPKMMQRTSFSTSVQIAVGAYQGSFTQQTRKSQVAAQQAADISPNPPAARHRDQNTDLTLSGVPANICCSAERSASYQSPQEEVCSSVPMIQLISEPSARVSASNIQERTSSETSVQIAAGSPQDSVNIHTARSQVAAQYSADISPNPPEALDGNRNLVSMVFGGPDKAMCDSTERSASHMESQEESCSSVPMGRTSNEHHTSTSTQDMMQRASSVASMQKAVGSVHGCIRVYTPQIQAAELLGSEVCRNSLSVNGSNQQVMLKVCGGTPDKEMCDCTEQGASQLKSREDTCSSLLKVVKFNQSLATTYSENMWQNTPCASSMKIAAVSHEESFKKHTLPVQSSTQHPGESFVSPLSANVGNQNVMPSVCRRKSSEKISNPIESSAPHQKSLEETCSSVEVGIKYHALAVTASTRNIVQRTSSVSFGDMVGGSHRECLNPYQPQHQAASHEPVEICLNPQSAKDRSQNLMPKVCDGTSNTAMRGSTEQHTSYQKTREETCSPVPMEIKFTAPPTTEQAQNMQQIILSTTFGQTAADSSQKCVKDPASQSQAAAEQPALHPLVVNVRNQPVVLSLFNGTPKMEICDSTEQSASHPTSQQETCLSVQVGIHLNTPSATAPRQEEEQIASSATPLKIAAGAVQDSVNVRVQQDQASAHQPTEVCLNQLSANDTNQTVTSSLHYGSHTKKIGHSSEAISLLEEPREDTSSSVPVGINVNANTAAESAQAVQQGAYSETAVHISAPSQQERFTESTLQGQIALPKRVEVCLKSSVANDPNENMTPKVCIGTASKEICDFTDRKSFGQKSQKETCSSVPAGMNFNATASTQTQQHGTSSTNSMRNVAGFLKDSDAVHKPQGQAALRPPDIICLNPLSLIYKKPHTGECGGKTNEKTCDFRVESVFHCKSQEIVCSSVPGGIKYNVASVTACTGNTQHRASYIRPAWKSASLPEQIFKDHTSQGQTASQEHAKISLNSLAADVMQNVMPRMGEGPHSEGMCDSTQSSASHQKYRDETCSSVPVGPMVSTSSPINPTQNMKQKSVVVPAVSIADGSPLDLFTESTPRGQVGGQQLAENCLHPLGANVRNQNMMDGVCGETRNKEMSDSTDSLATHQNFQEEVCSPVPVGIKYHARASTASTQTKQRIASSITSAQVATGSYGEYLTDHTRQGQDATQQIPEICLNPLAAKDRTQNLMSKVCSRTSNTAMCDSTEQRASYQKTREETCSSVPMEIMLNAPPPTAYSQNMQQIISSTPFGQIAAGPSQECVKDPTPQSQAATEQPTFYQLEVNDRNQLVMSSRCNGTPNKKVCDPTKQTVSNRNSRDGTWSSESAGIVFNAPSYRASTDKAQPRRSSVASEEVVSASPPECIKIHTIQNEGSAEQPAEISLNSRAANVRNLNGMSSVGGGILNQQMCDCMKQGACCKKSCEETCSSAPAGIKFNEPSVSAPTQNMQQGTSCTTSVQIPAVSHQEFTHVYAPEFQSGAERLTKFSAHPLVVNERSQNGIPSMCCGTPSNEMYDCKKQNTCLKKSQEGTCSSVLVGKMCSEPSVSASIQNMQQGAYSVTPTQKGAGLPREYITVHTPQSLADVPEIVFTTPSCHSDTSSVNQKLGASGGVGSCGREAEKLNSSFGTYRTLVSKPLVEDLTEQVIYPTSPRDIHKEDRSNSLYCSISPALIAPGNFNACTKGVKDPSLSKDSCYPVGMRKANNSSKDGGNQGVNNAKYCSDLCATGAFDVPQNESAGGGHCGRRRRNYAPLWQKMRELYGDYARVWEKCEGLYKVNDAVLGPLHRLLKRQAIEFDLLGLRHANEILTFMEEDDSANNYWMNEMAPNRGMGPSRDTYATNVNKPEQTTTAAIQNNRAVRDNVTKWPMQRMPNPSIQITGPHIHCSRTAHRERIVRTVFLNHEYTLKSFPRFSEISLPGKYSKDSSATTLVETPRDSLLSTASGSQLSLLTEYSNLVRTASVPILENIEEPSLSQHSRCKSCNELSNRSGTYSQNMHSRSIHRDENASVGGARFVDMDNRLSPEQSNNFVPESWQCNIPCVQNSIQPLELKITERDSLHAAEVYCSGGTNIAVRVNEMLTDEREEQPGAREQNKECVLRTCCESQTSGSISDICTYSVSSDEESEQNIDPRTATTPAPSDVTAILQAQNAGSSGLSGYSLEGNNYFDEKTIIRSSGLSQDFFMNTREATITTPISNEALAELNTNQTPEVEQDAEKKTCINGPATTAGVDLSPISPQTDTRNTTGYTEQTDNGNLQSHVSVINATVLSASTEHNLQENTEHEMINNQNHVSISNVIECVQNFQLTSCPLENNLERNAGVQQNPEGNRHACWAQMNVTCSPEKYTEQKIKTPAMLLANHMEQRQIDNSHSTGIGHIHTENGYISEPVRSAIESFDSLWVEAPGCAESPPDFLRNETEFNVKENVKGIGLVNRDSMGRIESLSLSRDEPNRCVESCSYGFKNGTWFNAEENLNTVMSTLRGNVNTNWDNVDKLGERQEGEGYLHVGRGVYPPDSSISGNTQQGENLINVEAFERHSSGIEHISGVNGGIVVPVRNVIDSLGSLRCRPATSTVQQYLNTDASAENKFLSSYTNPTAPIASLCRSPSMLNEQQAVTDFPKSDMSVKQVGVQVTDVREEEQAGRDNNSPFAPGYNEPIQKCLSDSGLISTGSFANPPSSPVTHAIHHHPQINSNSRYTQDNNVGVMAQNKNLPASVNITHMETMHNVQQDIACATNEHSDSRLTYRHDANGSTGHIYNECVNRSSSTKCDYESVKTTVITGSKGREMVVTDPCLPKRSAKRQMQHPAYNSCAMAPQGDSKDCPYLTRSTIEAVKSLRRAAGDTIKQEMAVSEVTSANTESGKTVIPKEHTLTSVQDNTKHAESSHTRTGLDGRSLGDFSRASLQSVTKTTRGGIDQSRVDRSGVSPDACVKHSQLPARPPVNLVEPERALCSKSTDCIKGDVDNQMLLFSHEFSRDFGRFDTEMRDLGSGDISLPFTTRMSVPNQLSCYTITDRRTTDNDSNRYTQSMSARNSVVESLVTNENVNYLYDSPLLNSSMDVRHGPRCTSVHVNSNDYPRSNIIPIKCCVEERVCTDESHGYERNAVHVGLETQSISLHSSVAMPDEYFRNRTENFKSILEHVCRDTYTRSYATTNYAYSNLSQSSIITTYPWDSTCKLTMSNEAPRLAVSHDNDWRTNPIASALIELLKRAPVPEMNLFGESACSNLTVEEPKSSATNSLPDVLYNNHEQYAESSTDTENSANVPVSNPSTVLSNSTYIKTYDSVASKLVATESNDIPKKTRSKPLIKVPPVSSEQAPHISLSGASHMRPSEGVQELENSVSPSGTKTKLGPGDPAQTIFVGGFQTQPELSFDVPPWDASTGGPRSQPSAGVSTLPQNSSVVLGTELDMSLENARIDLSRTQSSTSFDEFLQNVFAGVCLMPAGIEVEVRLKSACPDGAESQNSAGEDGTLVGCASAGACEGQPGVGVDALSTNPCDACSSATGSCSHAERPPAQPAWPQFNTTIIRSANYICTEILLSSLENGHTAPDPHSGSRDSTDISEVQEDHRSPQADKNCGSDSSEPPSPLRCTSSTVRSTFDEFGRRLDCLFDRPLYSQMKEQKQVCKENYK